LKVCTPSGLKHKGLLSFRLSTPGLRIPLTDGWKPFAEAADLGRTILWLHTFGERMADADKGRPANPPRMPAGNAPRIPSARAISQEPAQMPDTIDYDPGNKRLIVDNGYIEHVEPAVWNYEVPGKQALLHWFRKKNRERPRIGDRRPPSALGDIHPNHWLAEYTSELINVLKVLGLLVGLEPAQSTLLEKICSGSLISGNEGGHRTVSPDDVILLNRRQKLGPLFQCARNGVEQKARAKCGAASTLNCSVYRCTRRTAASYATTEMPNEIPLDRQGTPRYTKSRADYRC
jgi:Type ISP C-terminal specificity domain